VQKFPKISRVNERSARSGAERARGQRTRTNPEAAKRRRHVAEKVSAARAAAIAGDRARDIRAHPMATHFAQWIDTLHGQAGQVLHNFTSADAKLVQSRGLLALTRAAGSPEPPLAALLFAAVP